MPKKASQFKKRTGIKSMKLVAIKQECYAISGASNTVELKRKYKTLSQGRDFRRRKTWEYVLKMLRQEGDWLGIRVSDIESHADKEKNVSPSVIRSFTFHPERVAMDRDAENDD